MLRASRVAALSLLLSAGLETSRVGAAPTASLPLSRVRLYEVGVGYFERSGRLAKGTTIDVPLPAGHLDDALKSLVVLSPGGQASVTSVEFPSRVGRAMARAMSGLPSDGTELGLGALLESLKGARVSLTSAGGTVSGRLVEATEDVEREEPCKATQPSDGKQRCFERVPGQIALLTERGELVQLGRRELRSVRALDKATQARLESALDVLFRRGAAEPENLQVRAESAAPITLGYVAEAPLWRATYRLVLADAQARLQGWALLHNDSDEDWRGVRLEIANGQPESFLLPLAAPRYKHRRFEGVDDGSTAVPQLYTSVENLLDGEVGEAFGSGGLGLSGVGEGGGGRGEGIGLGSIGTTGPGAGAGSQSSLLDIGNLASTAQAAGAEAGALFTYTLNSPVDLRAHASALLPFLETPITAQRITWIPRAGMPAESGVHVMNSSSQTLPAGVASIFADGGFAGEVMLERLKPSESQIAHYGLDLDLELEPAAHSQNDEPRRLVYLGSQLEEHFVRRHQLSYRVKNRSASARRVYLGLDVVNNARVSAGASSGYDAQERRPWAAFDVAAHHEQTTQIKVDEGLSRLHEERALTSALLKGLAAAPTVPSGQRAILAQAGAAREVAERLEREIRSARILLVRVSRERQGYRDDLKALGGEDAEAIVERLGRAENERRTLERRIDVLTAKLASERARVRSLLLGLRGG